MDDEIVWIIDDDDDLGTCRSSDLVTLHNRYAIRKIEEIEMLKAEIERLRNQLSRFEECSDGCYDKFGQIHSEYTEHSGQKTYHKVGE